MNRVYSNRWVILSLVAPAGILFIGAILAPICLSVYFGMTQYSGMGTPVFVGMENFRQLIFHDEIFWGSLGNAVLLGLCFVFLQHPVCMIFAVLVDKVSGRFEKFFRAAYFVPNVISVAIIASMWVFIYNPDFGLLNSTLRAIGLGGSQEWLGNPELAIWSVVIVLVWHGFGWGLLIYYAGIKGIDTQLYEAAAIDGATGVQAFLRITIPMMRPVIRVNVTLAIISALKQMETVYLLTNGGPGNKTQFLANYLYQKAFSSYEYGYGNAISVLFVIVCMVATVLLNKIFQTKAEL